MSRDYEVRRADSASTGKPRQWVSLKRSMSKIVVPTKELVEKSRDPQIVIPAQAGT
jgi:hypothetical protein